MVLEREDRPYLHGLVVPEDRVRSDAALPVVDDRPLVVRPQKNEVAVQGEEIIRSEAFDLTVENVLTVADDAAQVSFGREHAAHRERSLGQTKTVTAARSASYTTSTTSPVSSPSTWSGSGSSQRTTIRSRSRAVSDLPSLSPEPRAPRASSRGTSRARSVTGATYASPSSKEALGNEVERDGSRIGVGGAVRDQHECRAAGAFDLELLVEASVPRPKRSRCRLQERHVTGPPPIGPAADLVDLPDEFGIEPDPGVEPEAAAVHASDADTARPPPGYTLRGLARVARETERPRKDARAAPREKADRHVLLEPVQHLVERAVAAEHIDRVDLAGRAHDLRRLARSGREQGLGAGGKRSPNRSEPVLVHAGGEWVDDEDPRHDDVA